MADIQIATFSNMVLSNGSYVLFDKPQYDFTKKVTLEGDLTIHLNGLCTGNVSTAFPLNGTFEISNQTNKMTKNFSFVNKCSRVDGTFILTLSEHSSTQFKLACEITYEKQGQTFSVASVQSDVKITGVKMEVQEFTLSYPAVPDHVSYSISRSFSLGGNTGQLISNPSSSGSLKLYYGDSISISANADENYADPTFYLNQSGTTSIASVTENVTAVVQTNGLAQYPITLNAAPNTEIYLYNSDYEIYGDMCDTCYCYCEDGTEIQNSQYCTRYVENKYSANTVRHGRYLQIRTYALSDNKIVSTTINGMTSEGGVDTGITVKQPLVISTVSGYTLTLNPAVGTTINVTNSSGQSLSNGATIIHGETLTISAVPSLSNYDVTGLLVNGNPEQSFTKTIEVSGNLTLATTSVGRFTLSVSQGANTTVTVSKNGTPLTDGAEILTGDVLTVTASAAHGYWIDLFKVNSQAYSGDKTVTCEVSGNVNITTTAVVRTILNLQIDQGIHISYQKQIHGEYEPECDGGCYCWCENNMLVNPGDKCPAEYEPISIETTPIFPNYVIKIIPSVDAGYTFDYFVVNGKAYDGIRSVTVLAGNELNISAYVVSDKWQVVASSLTLSGNGTTDVVKTINGLVKDKPTKIKVSSGNYYSSETRTVPPTSCDGCYCYCPDGSNVFEGQDCTQYFSNSESVNSGVYILTENKTIGLCSSSNVVGAELEISENNTLKFKGYNNVYSSKSKSLNIAEISQYNE